LDQHPLQPAHIRLDSFGVFERQDGIPDELARPVVGDVSAPIDLK
jgi:hypothetical protein